MGLIQNTFTYKATIISIDGIWIEQCLQKRINKLILVTTVLQ